MSNQNILYNLFSHNGTIVSLFQSPFNNKYLFSLSIDKHLKLWNLSEGNLIKDLYDDCAPTKLIYLFKFSILLIPKWNFSFNILNLKNFNIENIENINITEHKSWILNSIEFNLTKQYEKSHFITCSRDYTIKFFNINENYKCDLTLAHKNIVNDIKEIEENKIISCSSDLTIKLWNIKDFKGECLLEIYNGIYSIFQIELLKNNSFAVRDESTELKIYNFNTGKLLRNFNTHKTNIICFIVLKDYRIATGSYDHSIKIWNQDEEKELATLANHEFTVFSLLETKNGNLVSGGGDNLIKIWDLKNYSCINTLIGHSNYVVSLLELNSNDKNQLIASGSYDSKIIIWRLKN
jgi:WD40 repeat protein